MPDTIKRRTEMELSLHDKMRIVQELVPGKQVTLAHIIANPDKVIFEKMGLKPMPDSVKSAIGIFTVSPVETAVIAADIAVKSSGAGLECVDRLSGTMIITGSVSEVESAMGSICSYLGDKLGYTVCEITKT